MNCPNCNNPVDKVECLEWSIAQLPHKYDAYECPQCKLEMLIKRA